MSNIKVTFVIFVLFLLTACSIFEPFVDRRRNAGQTDVSKLYVGLSKPDAPAICANGLWTSQERIQEMADAECEKHNPGTHAVQTRVTHFSCKLLLPTHTYFKCEK